MPPELGEWVLRRTDQPGLRKALSARVSHRFTASSARFDEDNLVSHAGLVPLLGLAEHTRLPQIIAEKVSITTERIKSGAANPVPKLLGVIAGMCAGADSIDDLDMLRVGGMPILFHGVYAPSTLGTLLREFSFGHARQLESVLREHVCALTGEGRGQEPAPGKSGTVVQTTEPTTAKRGILRALRHHPTTSDHHARPT